MMLISYLDQLELAANRANLNLRHCFIKAGVPDSTYYRSKLYRRGDVKLTIARRVSEVIERERLST